MKQRPTSKQVDSLSEKGKDRWRKHWKPREFDVFLHYGTKKEYQVKAIDEAFIETWGKVSSPAYQLHLLIPSIGQMIEFLDPESLLRMSLGWEYWGKRSHTTERVPISSKELCDALWLATKEKLET